MPGVDPRFSSDEDVMTKKVLAYIELRQEHSRRLGDETVPEWDEFVVNYGMAAYHYKKPA